jgi:UDP-glucose 4-epimerase
VEHLSAQHRVIGMSRKAPPTPDREFVRGDCGSFEDLRQLDQHRIDAVVHLAGETGGAPEETALATNVLGTRRLLRYLGDRGCRKFVIASSIAVTGCLDKGFVPEQVPIAASHPCRAREAYGLSKSMLEQLADYFGRVVPDGEYTCLRFGWVMYSTRKDAPWCGVDPVPALPFLYLGQVVLADLLGGIEAVLHAPVRPGSRVYNLVGPDVRARAAWRRSCDPRSAIEPRSSS